MSAARSRRRFALRPWVAHALMAAAGVGLGVGGSVIWPWGFAPAPGTLELVQRPAPGRVLVGDDGDAAMVMTDTVHRFGPPPMAAGIVAFVRGRRHGRHATLVECYSGGRIQIGTTPATTWRSDGAGVADLAALALCADHPLTATSPEGSST